VLAVVEQQQDVTLCEPLRKRVRIRPSARLGKPNAAATAAPTSSAERSEPSHTATTPSGKCSALEAATVIASAVLPTPPGPISVVTDEDTTLSVTSATSRSLPTSRRGRSEIERVLARWSAGFGWVATIGLATRRVACMQRSAASMRRAGGVYVARGASLALVARAFRFLLERVRAAFGWALASALCKSTWHESPGFLEERESGNKLPFPDLCCARFERRRSSRHHIPMRAAAPAANPGTLRWKTDGPSRKPNKQPASAASGTTYQFRQRRQSFGSSRTRN